MYWEGSMKAFPANAALFAVFVLCVAATSTAAAQTSNKAIFAGPEYDPPWLCVGSGFVAMLRTGYHQPLIVVTIDRNGIEAPQRLSIEGNESFGMQCVGSHVELLVRETDSDHFSVLPFSVEQNTIEREQREDIDYSLALAGPMPSAIARRIDEFYRTELYPTGMLGDRYVQVWRIVGNASHAYAVHFVYTETRSRQGLALKLVVDLLEEALDKLPFSMKDGKVTQLVPLIREQTTYAGGD
jgi:hypothetical protein